MIKKILLGFSLLLGTAAIAQQGTATPYSFYGIGNVNYSGTNEYRAMGGTSVYADSIHINLQNPASYGKLKHTAFSIGATAKFYDFKANGQTDAVKRQSVDYIAIGLPIITQKLGVVFGLQPQSNVGYKITGIHTDENNRVTTNSYNGDGGVNRVFVGAGYEVIPHLHLGIDAGYHFGNTSNDIATWIKDRGDGIALATQTIEKRRVDYKGFAMKLSAQYEGKLNGYDWQTNITYSPETKWNTDNLTKLQTWDVYNPNRMIDQIITVDSDEKITNPQQLSLGAGIGKQFKWFIGGQFTYIENSKLATSTNVSPISAFENTKRYSIGGFYIPKHNSFTSYFNKVVYRAGFRYENTGLVLNNQSINDYAVSAGVGLPLPGRSLTNLNIGFEYGSRGKDSHGLIKENYFSINVGFSLNDIWFKRRRFE
ncbi:MULTISPECIES: hypothetical protein [Myroides]|uniref:Long-chain fatty acid transport protein n=1 Tax=Myroides albus TaxID=2562892 RepID=A0A6I3LF59_9FLAO|nr:MULTISPECIES: hypothetical protein [Myroides]MTG97098.1 hypothetical protein [Myroides albus]MVX36813.1 hypothetical protein [Myroides sp. LoEW2-1]UVD78479.1 hypothetical protein NWE55_10075 [Myroides albus]